MTAYTDPQRYRHTSSTRHSAAPRPMLPESAVPKDILVFCDGTAKDGKHPKR
jgi:hypothetical protein